ncbi:hypothetical protein [Rubrolithibacter danxiaensis]|uniref:hypothetical protein n=1 Tax=Rubrolithibacter danxiaensis TaxID=3390805 RepID=UPI003BF82466
MIFILILFASLILQLFLPWWIIGPVAFGFAAWKAYNGAHAFRSGFSAIFVLWIVMGLVKTLPNENILANRVGQMFMLPDFSFNWIIMLLISGIIGGVAAGFSALAGFYFRNAISRD